MIKSILHFSHHFAPRMASKSRKKEKSRKSRSSAPEQDWFELDGIRHVIGSAEIRRSSQDEDDIDQHDQMATCTARLDESLLNLFICCLFIILSLVIV